MFPVNLKTFCPSLVDFWRIRTKFCQKTCTLMLYCGKIEVYFHLERQGGKVYDQHLHHRHHHHLSGGNAVGWVCIQQVQQRQHRFLPRRPQNGAAGHGHERRSQRYVQLAADGNAGPCLPHRHRLARLDRHRPGAGHLAELAHRGPAAAAVFGQSGSHHRAAVPVPALPRPAQSAQRTGRGDHHRVLCALHGFGFCRLR